MKILAKFRFDRTFGEDLIAVVSRIFVRFSVKIRKKKILFGPQGDPYSPPPTRGTGSKGPPL